MMGQLCKEDLSVIFSGIEDPRLDRNKKYPLHEILFCAIYSAVQGNESWRGIEIMCVEKLDHLRNFFDFTQGIASHQTIARVFSLLKPKSFEQFFTAWAQSLSGSNDGKQIAFDGKSVRGSTGKNGSSRVLHLLHACAVDSGLTLAQLEVGPKENEITALPELIDSLDIKGAMVSVDALNTQKKTAEKIIDSEANYTLALKGNHPTLNAHVKAIFDGDNQKQLHEKVSPPKSETEKSHGRITTREHRIFPLLNDFKFHEKELWKGLKSVGKITNTVWSKGKETVEHRYYLLSYCDLDLFEKTARNHWAIEAMHWTLDVTFGEDDSLKRKDNAPKNYALVRKFALNMLRTFKGKLSVPNSQIKAACNNSFLETMLTGSGFSMVVK